VEADFKDFLSFTAGAVGPGKSCFCVLSEDLSEEADVAHSVFMVWEASKWKFVEEVVPWICASIAVDRSLKVAIAVGMWGEVVVINGLDCHVSRDKGIGNGPVERGPLRKIKFVDGVPVVCGADRQVYRKEDGEWVSVGPLVKSSVDDFSSFESVDGFSSSRLQAVGTQGEIWVYEDSKWSAVDSPTNAILADICCAPDGCAYICGRQGSVIVGRGSEWKILNHDFSDEDFWSVAWYKGVVYFASLNGLYFLGESGLQMVGFEPAITPGTFYQVVADENFLWSIGEKDVVVFDGKKWEKIA
jgi:hypothetical protein